MDIPNQEVGIKSANIPSDNLTSHFRPFKSKVFEVGLQQFHLLLIEYSGKKGMKISPHVIPLVVRSKKIHQSNNSQNSNIQAVVVFNKFDALNTPVLSFRP